MEAEREAYRHDHEGGGDLSRGDDGGPAEAAGGDDCQFVSRDQVANSRARSLSSTASSESIDGRSDKNLVDEADADTVLREEVLLELDKDFLACDLLVSLFVSAAQSYRHNSVLKPFPAAAIFNPAGGEVEKNVDKLRDQCSSIPRLSYLRHELQRGAPIPDCVIRLIHWILLGNPMGVKVRTLSEGERKEVLRSRCTCDDNNRSSPSVNRALPSHIFEVENNKSRKWNDRPSDNNETSSSSHYGFHGSRVENFHSILSHGLHQHLTTNALFGEGIYLSTDLGVSLSYSKTGRAWDKSALGEFISCVILCEVLDHKDVKLNVEDPSRNQIQGSQGGKVPQKYMVVRNNDVVRNRYLLVYAKESSRTPRVERRHTWIPPWMTQNSGLLIAISYMFLLMAIGIYDSPFFKRLLRRSGFIQD